MPTNRRCRQEIHVGSVALIQLSKMSSATGTLETIHRVIGVALLAGISAVQAQYLPPPAREGYRCEIDGKVTYSDDPCPGGARVDVTPTRGMDRMAGQRQMSDEVRRERFNETMAEALKPLFNETPEQREKRQRRSRLDPKYQSECLALDRKIPQAEEAEARASPDRKPQAQDTLYRLRKQYRDMRC